MEKFVTLILFLTLGCTAISQHGYLKGGLYPRHNEGVDGLSNKVVKWKAEASESVRYKMVELVVNPIIQLENTWPNGTRSYNFNTIMLETNVEGRVYSSEHTYVFLRKTDHRLIKNDDLAHCNCTYWNELGVTFLW